MHSNDPDLAGRAQGDIVLLRVHGMTCGHCQAAVENALRTVPGVKSAVVDLASKTARVVFEPGMANGDAAVAAVKEAGYSVAPQDG